MLAHGSSQLCEYARNICTANNVCLLTCICIEVVELLALMPVRKPLCLRSDSLHVDMSSSNVLVPTSVACTDSGTIHAKLEHAHLHT